MNEKITIENLKQNPRYDEAVLKLTKTKGFLSPEEISLLNLINQFEVQEVNRTQIEKTIDLTRETIASSKRTAHWTKLLAFATFSLALATAALVIVTVLKN